MVSLIQPNRIVLSALGTLAGAFFALAPVFLVQRGSPRLFDHWQELVFFALCIVGGGVSGAVGFSLSPGERELRRQRTIVWAGAGFFFLYEACSALCEKLQLGALNFELWRNLGLALLFAGAILRVWSIATLGRFHSGLVAIQPEHQLITSGPYRRLRHPSYLGVLMALTALPMIFGTWFPLLALPGVFVALKWRITDEEALLISHFGKEYEAYKSKTWRLVPYFY